MSLTLGYGYVRTEQGWAQFVFGLAAAGAVELRDSVADTLPPGYGWHSALAGGAACSVSHETQSTAFFLLIKHRLAPLVRARLLPSD